MIIEIDGSAWVKRLFLIGTAGLALFVSSACAVQTTYTTDMSSVVPESQAKRDLGMDYLSTGRTAMAIRELLGSLSMDPSDPKTHLWIGEAYRRKGQTAKAEGYLMEALALAQKREDTQTEHEARLNLSALLSQLGRYEESLPHCQTLALDPTFSTPWQALSNCGWALMKLGRLAEARSHFEDALDFFPRFSPALLNLGILDAKEGHRLAAIKNLEKALAARRLGASGYAEANYRLGELYVALGRREKAVEHFAAAAKVAPEADWGSQSQAYLDLLR